MRRSPPFTGRCHTFAMTLQSPADDLLPDERGVLEAYDVEPPYAPDAEALASLAKYEDRFLDRELSWLRFNLRLLEMAEDDSLPLLERVRSWRSSPATSTSSSWSGWPASSGASPPAWPSGRRPA